MTTSACPQCKEPGQVHLLDTEAFRHCPNCKLPLVIVAGKYKLTAKLSEGGCGVLYLSKHEAFGKDTTRVIKFIKPELCENEKTLKRLAREVQVTAALSEQSQHIVRVFDDYQNIEGLGSYYVMEYLDGEDLADLLDRTPTLSYKKIFHIFRQICEAMRDAHIAEVVHRDLKPQNIFLTQRTDDPLFVKIIDFGIAKTIDNPEQTKLTNGALGTPEYMSPEQCKGDDITPAADIYAMGIILYEMIVGYTPFLTPSTKNPAAATIVLAHIMSPPPPPSSETKRKIPKRLEEIVLKCLAKKPEDRYPDTKALLADMNDLGAKLESAGMFAANVAKDFSAIDELDDNDDEDITSIASSASLLEPWHRPLPTAEPPLLDSIPPMPSSPTAEHLGPASSIPTPQIEQAPPITQEDTDPTPVKKGGLAFVLVGLVLFVVLGGWYVTRTPTTPISKRPTPPARTTKQSPLRVRPTKQALGAPTPQRDAGYQAVTPQPAPSTRRKRPQSKRPQSKRPLARRRRRNPKRVRRTKPRRRLLRTKPQPVPRAALTNTAAPGCPLDTPGRHWVRADLYPRGTRMLGSYKGKQYKGSFLCFQKPAGQPVSTVGFKRAGYATCIVLKVPANRRRFRVKLQPQTDGISAENGYCIK